MTSSTVPRLALAVAHGHAIFLDCGGDRYFALSPAENDALIALLAGDPIPERARRALTAVIGTEASTSTVRAMLAIGHSGGLVRSLTPDTPTPWMVRLAAIGHLVAAKVMLTVHGLHASLDRLANIAVPTIADGQAPGHRNQIIGAHEWLSRHVTANDACLLRSLALARHLRSSACAAQLVIAVHADPFSAHCWVQADNHLLNDDPDHVASYEPILVVR